MNDLPKLPEPVAYIDQHRAKRLGQRIPMLTTLTVHRAFLDDVGLYTADQMRAYANQVREQALEEAAKVCELFCRYEPEETGCMRHHRDGSWIEADACAAAIRKLKERSNVQP